MTCLYHLIDGPDNTCKQVLEGFLYYFPSDRMERILTTIAKLCPGGSLVLADHVNEFTLRTLEVSVSKEA